MPVAATALVYSNGTNTALGMLQKSYVTHTAAYTAVAGDQIFVILRQLMHLPLLFPQGLLMMK